MCNVSLNGTQPTDASLRVLRALEDAGLEAWFVGGWVRDALMGRPSHDVDMCCSGLWQESKAALEAAGIAVVESGIKFGGITALCDDVSPGRFLHRWSPSPECGACGVA